MIRITIIGIILIGSVFVAYSFSMPYYRNEQLRDKLDLSATKVMLSDPIKSQKAKERYYIEVEKIRTNKAFYQDLGSGLIISSACFLVFLLIFKVHYISDFKKVRSLNKRGLFISAIGVWLTGIPSSIWYYGFRASRNDYPSWADAVAIPIFQETAAIIFGLIILLPFLIASSWKKKLPVDVFLAIEIYTLRAIIVESFWGIIISLNLILLYFHIVDGNHLTIVLNMYFLFIILILRACQVNALNQRNYCLEKSTSNSSDQSGFTTQN